MERFPICTFTIVNSAEQTILHSPALPRPGVPYLDVSDSIAWRLTIVAQGSIARDAVARDAVAQDSRAQDSVARDCVAQDRVVPEATLRDGELRISIGFEEFARLERLLLAAPRESRGKRYPFSVVTDPPCIEFETDNERVVQLKLPG